MGKDNRTAMGSVSGDVVPLTRIGTDEVCFIRDFDDS